MSYILTKTIKFCNMQWYVPIKTGNIDVIYINIMASSAICSGTYQLRQYVVLAKRVVLEFCNMQWYVPIKTCMDCDVFDDKVLQYAVVRTN